MCGASALLSFDLSMTRFSQNPQEVSPALKLPDKEATFPWLGGRWGDCGKTEGPQPVRLCYEPKETCETQAEDATNKERA